MIARHLDETIARGDPALVHLAVAPQWDTLRADVRFRGDVAEGATTSAAQWERWS
jgi:hypothetical protein